jgi:formate C-acetyltransferase
MAPHYEKVLTRGLKGVKEEVAAAMENLNLIVPEDLKKHQFLKAVNITLDAACGFAQRYAGFAETLAEAEPDRQRKEELHKIAVMCRHVPAEPARTFHEALQSIYFVWLVIMLEGWGHGNSFGRPDQYLYPFYKKDLEEGRLTIEEARELIGLLYIKANATVTLDDTVAASIFAGFPQTVNINLGGLTKDGKDAVNDLSYLFLDAEMDVRMTMEDIIIRVHRNTPDAFIMKACEVAKALRGKLKFLSDETTIQQMLNDRYPIEYARDYIITGCNSPSTPGYSFDVPGGMFNLPLMLELALNNGKTRMSGEQLGPETGDPRSFTSYDDLWHAYQKQVEFFIGLSVLYINADRQLFAEFAPTPFLSSLFNGPVDKGRDIHDGGTFPYVRQAISLSGAPNVGDSLAAVKKLVFEDKKITMDRLITALDRNFEDEKEFLHMVSSVPRFGNDDDYVDTIVNDVLVHAASEVGKYKAFCGTPFNAAAAVVTANLPLGSLVGALPDGRRSGEPLSDGGISPCHGRNVSGPTATMKSVAKLDHVKLTNGSVLNMRFNPRALNGEANLKRFASLIRTFCETGGFLVQFNIVDSEMLRVAQKSPEKYKDLLVRVATYSAYFVELSPEMQEDVIMRTEFSEL